MVVGDFTKLNIEELKPFVLYWHSKKKGEQNKSRLYYCQSQVTFAIKELIERRENINQIFSGTSVLNFYLNKK